MKPKMIGKYLSLAGVLLLITAAAKLVSSFGGSRVLQVPDPFLAFPFQYMLWGVGAIELAIALVCFFSKQTGLKAGLVAWLATNFVIYRLGLIWVGYHKPCGCLGNLTDMLHISPQTADNAMKVVLVYLLISSYGTLFWLWREGRKTSPVMDPKI